MKFSNCRGVSPHSCSGISLLFDSRRNQPDHHPEYKLSGAQLPLPSISDADVARAKLAMNAP